MADQPGEADVLERARHLFRQYYASCFWHMKPDLPITEATLPVIIKGLRAHGGRSGFLAADQLETAARQAQCL